MTPRPRNIDEYLAALGADKRAALEKLRKTIQATAPKAEECIRYQLPAFRLDGRTLERYDTSKGTIRFQADDPLPAALVRKLVKARIAENAG